VNTFSPQKNQ